MKLLLVLSITLSAAWAEPQYAASGWRPEGRAFELPERTPKQYLPPVQPRVPLPRDLDEDVAVQGLPDDYQLPQFQRNEQYQPQRQSVQRPSPPSQTVPNVTPRQFTTRPVFSSARPTISSTSTSTTTQSDLNEGEEQSENDNQQNNGEEEAKKQQQPDIILTPVAQIRLQTISTNPSFNQNQSPFLTQAAQESNPGQFNGYDGRVQFAALQRILAQQNVVPQSYVQTKQVVIQTVPEKSGQIQSNPVVFVSQNLSPPQKLQSSVGFNIEPVVVQYQSQNIAQNRDNEVRQSNQGQTSFVVQTQGYQPQDVQVTTQNVQLVPQNVGYQPQYDQSDVQNGQYVSQNVNYPQLNIQYQDQTVQYQPENVQYQPQSVQYQPQNLQFQPQNVQVQTDNVQYQNVQVQTESVQPQTVQYQQPNVQYQPQNIQYEPQNIQIQTENVQPQVKQYQQPNVQYQQPNVQFTAQTLQSDPLNVQYQGQIKPTLPQNVEYQPQIVQLQPLNVQLQPQNVQVQPQNVQLFNGQYDTQKDQNQNYDLQTQVQSLNVYQGANYHYQPQQGQLANSQSEPGNQYFNQGFSQNQQFDRNQQVAQNQQTYAQKQQFAQNQQYNQFYTQNQEVAQDQQYAQNQQINKQYAQNQPFAKQQFYQYQQLNQIPLTNQQATNQGADSLQSGLDVNKQSNDLGDEKTTVDVNDDDDDDESTKEATTKVYRGFGDRTRSKFGVPIPKQISTTSDVASDEIATTENNAARTDSAGNSGRHGRRKSAKLRNRRVRPVFTVDSSGHLVLSGEQA